MPQVVIQVPPWSVFGAPTLMFSKGGVPLLGRVFQGGAAHHRIEWYIPINLPDGISLIYTVYSAHNELNSIKNSSERYIP